MENNKIKGFFQLIYNNSKNLLKRGTFDFPIAVEIETITYCNRKCSYCPNSKFERGNINNKKLIDAELFKKIIDELAEKNFSGRISPHFYGEPLLDKRLPALIAYSKQKIPKSKIVIFSNGDLLTPQKYKELKNSGVSKFIITQHFPKLSDNMEKLLEYKRKNKDSVKITYIKNIEKSNLDNRGGLVQTLKKTKRKRCHLPFSIITIDYNGNVILCCNDYHSKIKFGNVKDEKLFDIWDKKSYKDLRKNLIKGKFNLEICRKCVDKY